MNANPGNTKKYTNFKKLSLHKREKERWIKTT